MGQKNTKSKINENSSSLRDVAGWGRTRTEIPTVLANSTIQCQNEKELLENLDSLNEIFLNLDSVELSGIAFRGDLFAKLLLAVEAHTQIGKLQFLNCRLGTQGIVLLSNLLAKPEIHITLLDLSQCDLCIEDIVKLSQSLLHNSSLTVLKLGFNFAFDQGTRAITQSLSNNTTLSELDLSGNRIGPFGLEYLGELISKNSCCLKKLNYENNYSASSGIKKFARIWPATVISGGQLTELNISNNNIKNSGIKVLSYVIVKWNALRKLNIGWNHLQARDAPLVAENLLVLNTHLEELNLNHLMSHSAALYFLKALEKNKNLISINLGYLDSFSELTSEQLSKTITQNQSLKNFELRNNHLTNSHLTSISKSLCQNTALTSISLSHNFIDAQSMNLIGQILENSSQLKMDLTGNKFSQNELEIFGDRIEWIKTAGKNLRNKEKVNNNVKKVTPLEEGELEKFFEAI